jgi:AcrR family transcriptional regulator
MKAGHQSSTGYGDPIAPDPTHAKLLDAAREVFAEWGYYGATVRKICTRAGANVAAVNYHFGGKMGLYTEVLRQLVSAVHSTHRENIRRMLGEHGTPEEVLREVIRAMLKTMVGANRPTLHFRLMAHEFAQPTPALSRIIEEETRPNYDRLRELIGQILRLPRDHEKTRLCAHSVIGQVVHYVHAGPIMARLWPELKMTPEQLEQIADHITEFSLAYLRKTHVKRERVMEKRGTRRRT